MCHICYLGLSFLYYLKRRETFSVFLNLFSRFHKTKAMTFKKNLRHSSLHPDPNSMSVKFQWLKLIIK